MIDRIKGILLAKGPASTVIEVGGIGFSILIPLTTWEKLGTVGGEATLFTHLHVREDILQLYGFHSSAEREAFLLLISVNGVGPKMALAILSKFDRDGLSEVVRAGDLRRLQAVPGVGKKTAERLLVELKDKLGVASSRGGVSLAALAAPSPVTEAIMALETLGFTLQQADEAIRRAEVKIGNQGSVEDLVREALRGR